MISWHSFDNILTGRCLWPPRLQDNDVGGGEEEDEVETRTLQVVLPHEHPAWVGGQTSLYLCSETKTFHFGGEVIKWTPMGPSSSFKLSPPSNDYILNEAAGGLLKLPTSAGDKTGKLIFMVHSKKILRTIFTFA